MKRWLRRKIVSWLVKDILLAVQKEDVFRAHEGQIYAGGEQLNENDRYQLEKDAETLSRMRLWEYLKRDLEYHAYTNGWMRAQTDDDVLVGKMLLYYTQLVDSKLNDIALGKWYNIAKGNAPQRDARTRFTNWLREPSTRDA